MIFRTFHVDAQNLNSKFLRDLILNNVETSVMSNIIVGYYFDIKKKISREFGVPPATVYILRPATFLESAQNFDQNGPKYPSGIDFMNQNVALYRCNLKKK